MRFFDDKTVAFFPPIAKIIAYRQTFAYCDFTILNLFSNKTFQKAMQQFEWHDGSVKNVHVDMAMLFEYQVNI